MNKIRNFINIFRENKIMVHAWKCKLLLKESICSDAKFHMKEYG